jgi:hypothetical protein
MGASGYAEAQLLLMGMAIGLALLSYVFFKTLRFVLSSKQGRAQLTLRMFKVWLKRIAVVTVVVFGLNYACDVGLRSKAHECHIEKSKKDGGLYDAELCYLTGNSDGYTMRLRLYSSKDGSLLAERTFTDLDPELVWSREWIGYNVNGGDAYVPLPPSWLDRMRAKLP